jgi:hypothetical protein
VKKEFGRQVIKSLAIPTSLPIHSTIPPRLLQPHVAREPSSVSYPTPGSSPPSPTSPSHSNSTSPSLVDTPDQPLKQFEQCRPNNIKSEGPITHGGVGRGALVCVRCAGRAVAMPPSRPFRNDFFLGPRCVRVLEMERKVSHCFTIVVPFFFILSHISSWVGQFYISGWRGPGASLACTRLDLDSSILIYRLSYLDLDCHLIQSRACPHISTISRFLVPLATLPSIITRNDLP